MAGARNIIKATWSRILDSVGGPARLQIIAILAAVLGLDTAQLGTLSAVADLLKKAFDIGNTQIGLLLAVVSFVGALSTLPMGIFADRVRRQYVLIAAVLIWAAAMVLSGTATSYGYLLGTRIFLGAITAAAWPCIASLTGDFFPARDRASIYGMILSGELIGAGLGFFIAGEVSNFSNWRWAFFVMASPSLLIAWVLWRFLPEPQRGGQRWLEAGEENPAAASHPADRQSMRAGEGHAESTIGGTATADSGPAHSMMQKKVAEAHVKPRPGKIIRKDPTRWNIWRTMIYLLSLPTYSLLIVASTLAYFFFSGSRAFAMIYFSPHYHLARSVVSALVIALGLGAIVGLLLGGYVSRRLLFRGYINARIIVPACALAIAVPFFAAGIWVHIAWIGVPLLVVGVAAMTAALAPIDAARLDIIHPRLWGRGEAGRMALRASFEGGAPLLFGAMSKWLAGGNTTHGLLLTFEIMLLPMLIAALIVIPGLRTYPRDVATAAASAQATEKKGDPRSIDQRQSAEHHPAE
jgi:predicted MFS family arabinose efflux permease